MKLELIPVVIATFETVPNILLKNKIESIGNQDR